MSSTLPTEEGKNWLVLVFECPIFILDKVLMECFDLLERIPDIAQIPHYMIRGKESLSEVIVSLRILRKKEDSKLIEEYLTEILNKSDLRDKFIFDPESNERLYKYHAWIKHDIRDENWNRDQCEILNELSSFCISLMKKKLFFYSGKYCAQEHSLHLLNWMLGFREFQRVYYELLIKDHPPKLVGEIREKKEKWGVWEIKVTINQITPDGPIPVKRALLPHPDYIT